MKVVNLPRQYQSIKPEIDEAIQSVLNSGRFVGGPYVEKFEGEFAEYVGVKHCVGVASGTDALRIVLEASGVTSKVIVPANTFFGVAEVVLQLGCSLAFWDCGPDIHTMVNLFVSDSIQAAIVVHPHGHPCNMNGMIHIANREDTIVIEDCSHAHGAKYNEAKYNEKSVGSIGHAGVFSFNPSKVLGACGDAGCIVTDDSKLAERCRIFADHGRRDKHTHYHIGYNSRLDTMQAAILSVKLKYLDEWVLHRRKVADRYRQNLEGVVTLPVEAEWAYHSYHQFVIRLPERDKVRQMLSTVYDIETGIHYPLSLPEQPALAHLGVDPSQFLATEYARQILSLPIHETMRMDEVDVLCDALREIVNG
jgi:dTDP-4-amino-4,6-dideoxygalactose transaminase